MDSRLIGETTYKKIKIVSGIEKSNPELYKQMVLYNQIVLTLEKARAMVLIAKIREEALKGVDEKEKKYPDSLSEKGKLLCEELEHQCEDIKSAIANNIEFEEQEFDRENFLKEKAPQIINELKENDRIEEETKKIELEALREALRYDENDYKRRIPELLNKRIKRYSNNSEMCAILTSILNVFNESRCSKEKYDALYVAARAESLEEIAKAFYPQTNIQGSEGEGPDL